MWRPKDTWQVKRWHWCHLIGLYWHSLSENINNHHPRKKKKKKTILERGVKLKPYVTFWTFNSDTRKLLNLDTSGRIVWYAYGSCPRLNIDYSCKDGRFWEFATWVTISNPDSLSSSETRVDTGIRSWKMHLYLTELNVRKPLMVSNSQISEELRLYNQVENLTISNPSLEAVPSNAWFTFTLERTWTNTLCQNVLSTSCETQDSSCWRLAAQRILIDTKLLVRTVELS